MKIMIQLFLLKMNETPMKFSFPDASFVFAKYTKKYNCCISEYKQ